MFFSRGRAKVADAHARTHACMSECFPDNLSHGECVHNSEGARIKNKSHIISALAISALAGVWVQSNKPQKKKKNVYVYCSTCQDRRVLVLPGVSTCHVIPTFCCFQMLILNCVSGEQ